MKTFVLSLFAALIILTANAKADGISPYLPLKTDPLFELELERLASITDLPVMSKPYHAATINNYLQAVKESHPTLYKRINTYLKRYKKKIWHYSLQSTLCICAR